jgi:hypothetical protein
MNTNQVTLVIHLAGSKQNYLKNLQQTSISNHNQVVLVDWWANV